jgi:long-chain acyl-CoA synthetase
VGGPAVVVRRPAAALRAAELRAFAAGSLARFKVPTGVHFVSELPHSLAGKVSRARLRELGLERAAAAAGGAADERTRDAGTRDAGTREDTDA